MQAPYTECAKCVATAWCTRYKGTTPKPTSPEWCNPKFRLDKALKLANLPVRYLKANKYNYKTTTDNLAIAKKLKVYLDDIVATVQDGKQFLFHGLKPGTGKTFNGSMLLNQYIYKTCLTDEFDFENPLAFFISYADLMDKLRYEHNDEATSHVLEIVKNVPLLLLDDIGAGTCSQFTEEQTYIILNYRYNKGLSTIYTTNLKLDELVEAIGRRTLSRMLSNCEQITFAGSDLRLKE